MSEATEQIKRLLSEEKYIASDEIATVVYLATVRHQATRRSGTRGDCHSTNHEPSQETDSCLPSSDNCTGTLLHTTNSAKEPNTGNSRTPHPRSVPSSSLGLLHKKVWVLPAIVLSMSLWKRILL